MSSWSQVQPSLALGPARFSWGEEEKEFCLTSCSFQVLEFGVFSNDGMIREIIAHPYKLFTDYKTAQQLCISQDSVTETKSGLGNISRMGFNTGDGVFA